MKRILLVLASLLLLAACSSTANAKLPLPGLEIEELVNPSSMGYPVGAIDVQYALRIGNRADQQITLRRLEISSDNMGAYQLRRESKPFNVPIGPGESREVQFWVHAFAVNGARQNAPVTVRGILYYDSPAGPLHQYFQANLTQF